MKRHIKQFCLPVLAALAAACSDFDLQDQFDAEFHKVVDAGAYYVECQWHDAF